MPREKVTISWSGGKDSAFALYKVLQEDKYEVTGLHTVIAEDTRRVGLHGVREELIETQANALGLPLTKLYLKTANDHQAYESLMRTFYTQCAAEGIAGVVFGDIFLEDLKKFREELLGASGLFPVFPIWKQDSAVLIHDFIAAGFYTVLCSANSAYFTEEKLGKTIDHAFVANLPAEVDPCGENGEFHTFVYNGPYFKRPVAFDAAEVIKKTYSYQRKNDDDTIDLLESSFWFQELLPRTMS